jgi:large subunit ribosomal protein L10
MPSTKKIFTVQNLAEKLNQAKGLVLVDYTGLNVSQINELRGKIKKAGGEFEVVKNTLLRLAAENSKFPAWRQAGEIQNSKLSGPTAVLWLYAEDFSPLKVLEEFRRQLQLPKIKFGFWEREEIDEERITQLANLPGIDQLRGQLLAFFQSPLFRLVNALSGNLKKLILVLKAKGGEKEN